MIKKQMIEIGNLMYQKGYNVSIDGNISVKLAENKILITATGCQLGRLTDDDIVLIDNEGNLLEGGKNPTSELYLHTLIYKNKKGINSIIHAHAPNCISLSLLDINIKDNLYINMAPIPITKYAKPSSIESYKSIEPFLQDYNWAILKRHGVVTYEKDLMSAFLRLEGMENFAKILIGALSVYKDIKPLSEKRKNELLRMFGIIK